MLEGAVVGAFGIVREDTGRKLAHAGMIPQAFTAIAFAWTGFVTAVAAGQVLLLDTIHP